MIVQRYEVVEVSKENTQTLAYTDTTNSTAIGATSEVTTNEATITDTTYADENIQITLHTVNEYDTEVYIADVQVSSVEYLQSAFAENSYGRNISEHTSTIASNHNAILAINGDYYGFRNNGFVLRNGVLYRSTAQSDGTEDLVIYSDGSFAVVDESSTDAEELLNDGAVQIYSFGPSLIVEGELTVDTNSEVSSRSMNSNPRTAIGMIDPQHYIFVVSDGRTSASAGLSLYELATIMQDYGCTVAYNLDGGGSSTMIFNGEVVNNPTSGHGIGERAVSDIIYIGY